MEIKKMTPIVRAEIAKMDAEAAEDAKLEAEDAEWEAEDAKLEAEFAKLEAEWEAEDAEFAKLEAEFKAEIQNKQEDGLYDDMTGKRIPYMNDEGDHIDFDHGWYGQ